MTKSEKPPLVSIGMPVYDGEKTIRQALDSLLAQNFRDFELIISDNASTDSTGNICQQYAARDPRVRYYRNETNIGPTANFNRLIYMANGKYFMWAADDDLWEPPYISHMVKALDSNPDAVLSFCRFDSPSADEQPLIYKDKWEKIIGRDRFNRLFHTCYLIPWAENRACYIYGLVRKEILLNCGGLETRVDVYRGADIVTLFHLLYYGKFVKVDEVLYHRRYNSDRISLKEPIIQRMAKQSLYSLVISYFKWLTGWHEHYHILRAIVKETSLQVPHKIILLLTLYISELLFYFNNLEQTFICSICDYLKILKLNKKVRVL